MRYCLDTNTIAAITSARPHLELVAKLDAHKAESGLPSVVLSEWLFAVHTIREPFRASVMGRALVWMEGCEVIPFDEEDGHLDASLRHELAFKKVTVDGLIAAMALRRGLIVVTMNVKRFAPFARFGLQVETW